MTSLAQCSFGVALINGGSTSIVGTTIGQSFKPTCTAKLDNITFKTNNLADDLRGSNVFFKLRLKDATGTILANATMSNGTTKTDLFYPGATIVADFACTNLTLSNGTIYIWEMYFDDPLNQVPGAGGIYLGYGTANTYADGTFIQDNVVQASKDCSGWSVNLTTTVNSLSATQSQTNPSSAITNDGSASVADTGGNAAATTTYVWKKNGNVIAGQTNASITNQGVGNYTCDITKGGCTIQNTFSLSVPLSTTDFALNSYFKVFPNPTTGVININMTDFRTAKTTLYDLNGKVLKTQVIENTSSKINISDLSKGVYLLKIETENGSITKQIIKD